MHWVHTGNSDVQRAGAAASNNYIAWREFWFLIAAIACDGLSGILETYAAIFIGIVKVTSDD